MLKGLVTLGLLSGAILVPLGLGWVGGFEMTEPFNNLKSLRTPVVTSTSSGVWFLTLAVVGWRTSIVRPAAVRTKSH